MNDLHFHVGEGYHNLSPTRGGNHSTPTHRSIVYSGRVKEAWKLQSKLAFRAKRRQLRQQGKWGETRKHDQQKMAMSSRR